MHANARDAGKVVIAEYDPGWPLLFETLRLPLVATLGEIAVAIEHVGSTAVPGLAAKPIIDVDVVLRSLDDLGEAASLLATIGYIHQGDLGIRGREAFTAPSSSPKHHLYVCSADNDELRRHSLFRDDLIAHPDKAAEYAILKKEAARRFADDRIAYTSAKGQFIEGILRSAGSGGWSPGDRAVSSHG